MRRHVVMLLSNAFRPDPRVLKEAESLTSLGHRITIVCWDRASEMKREEMLESGVRIIRIQRVRSLYGIGIRQIFRLPRFWLATLPILSQLHPDLLHCHDFDTLPLGLLWAKLHRLPIVYDAHEYYAQLCQPRLTGLTGRLLYRFIEVAERTCARLTSAVVTVDESLGALYRHTHRPVFIVGHYPNRIYAQDPNPVFSRLHLTLIYIGRLSVDRGLLIYVDLLRLLRELGVPARLRLLGVFTSPQEEEQFRRLAGGLREAVELMGWIPYPQTFSSLKEADVGLALLQPEPRYLAALPVKLFEYMAAGLPVVASHFAPIERIFSEAPCGVLVDPQDVEESARHISYWWKHPDEARSAGERGRQAILRKYHWERVADQLDSLYRSLKP